MKTKWGTCVAHSRTIWINPELAKKNPRCLEYIVVHELTHLLHAGHGPDFWATLAVYPRTERARGFLEGVAFAPESASEQDDDVPATYEPDDSVDL